MVGSTGASDCCQRVFQGGAHTRQRAAGGVRAVRWGLSLSPESGGQLCQELCIVVVVVVGFNDT